MKLSAGERRTIVRSIAVLVPVAVWFLGVRPYRAALTEARDRLAVEQDALARERGAVATARRNPELQHLTDSVLHAIEPRLFEGRDDVVTSSELAAYLGDAAFDHHVWMQDATTKPVTTTSTGVRILHVEVRAESDFQGILSFLQALEHGDKYVRIERFDLARGVGSAGNENGETLLLSATIAGYALGTSSAAAPAPAAKPPAAAAKGLP
jgi:hypothetical protein